MKTFNFYKFLTDSGYDKEVISEISGETFCTVYQKELAPNLWNALTVHKNKTFTSSSPGGNLEYKEVEQPTTEEEAKKIIEVIEKI